MISVILKENNANRQTPSPMLRLRKKRKEKKIQWRRRRRKRKGRIRKSRTRSSPAKHRGTREVSAHGGAWARFEPRLKTDKDIDGVGGAGVVQGGGLLQSPLGSYSTRSRYASGSGSEREC